VIRLKTSEFLNSIDRRVALSLAVRKYLKDSNLKKYDLLHSLSLNEASFLDYSKISIPTIVSVNDYYALASSWLSGYKSTDSLKRYFHHNIMRHFNLNALKGCSEIIANSKYTANVISNLIDQKINVVYRGIDAEKFNIRLKPSKYRSHNVLFIGFSMERKGALYLLKAMPTVIKQFPDASITLIGTPSSKFNKIINPLIH